MEQIEPLLYHDNMRLRTAARHVKVLYPGVVGEILARDIQDYIEFGYRFAVNAAIPRLVTEVMNSALPESGSMNS